MNSTLIMSSSTVTSPTSPLIKAVVGITTATQVTYSIICTIAFLGNTLVILVFVWDKKLLNKSYNILILSVAIADVLTAITLITNPAFVIGDGLPHPTPSWASYSAESYGVVSFSSSTSFSPFIFAWR